MTTPSPSKSTPDAELIAARENAHANLAALEHYARLTRGHLEIADDAGALYDLTAAQTYFQAAIRAFEPVRAAFRARCA